MPLSNWILTAAAIRKKQTEPHKKINNQTTNNNKTNKNPFCLTACAAINSAFWHATFDEKLLEDKNYSLILALGYYCEWIMVYFNSLNVEKVNFEVEEFKSFSLVTLASVRSTKIRVSSLKILIVMPMTINDMSQQFISSEPLDNHVTAVHDDEAMHHSHRAVT